MTRTTRKDYTGAVMHDGEHGKKCGSANCSACVTGHCKRPARRALRRTERTAVTESQRGNA